VAFGVTLRRLFTLEHDVCGLQIAMNETLNTQTIYEIARITATTEEATPRYLRVHREQGVGQLKRDPTQSLHATCIRAAGILCYT
jgi:hypothetical protein